MTYDFMSYNAYKYRKRVTAVNNTRSPAYGEKTNSGRGG